MKDEECVRFLQWVLPQMQMRWPGFRKIRSRLCRRLKRHITSLELSDISEYQEYLSTHENEWLRLDELCQITISRFYRDKMVFRFLAETVLPMLCEQARKQGRKAIHLWSAGCASGEEPYTLELLWAFSLASKYPDLRPQILATDTKSELLSRAETACYPFSSIRNLPEQWRTAAFSVEDEEYCLLPEYHQHVRFEQHDIRQPALDGGFDMVLCRNLAFTYYDQELQKRVAHQLIQSIRPNGVLVLGVHEQLPEESAMDLEVLSERFSVFQKH